MEAVEAGSLEPGETLVESELVQWAGVSRQPIREALSRMEDLGLVIVSPQRSTVIAPIDAVDVANRFEAFGVLLAATLRDGAELFSDEDIATIAATLGGTDRVWPFAAGGLADEAFARFGNVVLAQMWESTRPHARRLRAVSPDLLPLELGGLELPLLRDAVGQRDGLAMHQLVLTWTNRFIEAAHTPGPERDGTV